jgi:predicted nucleic-acid-binding Zn-ribbon protein
VPKRPRQTIEQLEQLELACPVCGGREFKEEHGASDSRWGITRHRMIMLICTRCAYILNFYDKRAYFFDFD